jgi:hypothetical protein
MFSRTAIKIIKWVKKFAVAQAKVIHILRPGKASEKTPKGVIPPSLCEISQNASREKKTRNPIWHTSERIPFWQHCMQCAEEEEPHLKLWTGSEHVYSRTSKVMD